MFFLVNTNTFTYTSFGEDVTFHLIHKTASMSLINTIQLCIWNKKLNPEQFNIPCAAEAAGRHALTSSGHHVSGVSRDQQLHAVHLADLQAGQQRAAAHVPGERTFTASLSRNGREGTPGAGMCSACKMNICLLNHSNNLSY